MAKIPAAQAPPGLQAGQVVQLSNGMPVRGVRLDGWGARCSWAHASGCAVWPPWPCSCPAACRRVLIGGGLVGWVRVKPRAGWALPGRCCSGPALPLWRPPLAGPPLPARPWEQAFVVAVDEEGVTIDANHPMAGKDLTFDVEVRWDRAGALALTHVSIPCGARRWHGWRGPGVVGVEVGGCAGCPAYCWPGPSLPRWHLVPRLSSPGRLALAQHRSGPAPCCPPCSPRKLLGPGPAPPASSNRSPSWCPRRACSRPPLAPAASGAARAPACLPARAPACLPGLLLRRVCRRGSPSLPRPCALQGRTRPAPPSPPAGAPSSPSCACRACCRRRWGTARAPRPTPRTARCAVLGIRWHAVQEVGGAVQEVGGAVHEVVGGIGTHRRSAGLRSGSAGSCTVSQPRPLCLPLLPAWRRRCARAPRGTPRWCRWCTTRRRCALPSPAALLLACRVRVPAGMSCPVRRAGRAGGPLFDRPCLPTPHAGLLRRAAGRVLAAARPHAAQPPGRRRGHAVPVRPGRACQGAVPQSGSDGCGCPMPRGGVQGAGCFRLWARHACRRRGRLRSTPPSPRLVCAAARASTGTPRSSARRRRPPRPRRTRSWAAAW